ncbi:CCA tRNA nucleotidyltransferase [Alphaproteobacteria bacterium]|nr:CCA tRNA nucleotidyltransferase [Alphaproteobacteria bacterium]
MKPSKSITPLEWMESEEIQLVIRSLNSDSLDGIKHDNVKFVGGCVRDIFSSSILSKGKMDIDFATVHEPKKVIQLLSKNKIEYKTSGIKYGTITIKSKNFNIQITTLRKDVKTDGRYAIVEYTTDWDLDAKRRDFTFNAIYLDIDGTVYDPFNGINDLEDGIVRFIGNPDIRIQEDYLRILRYFRFLGIYSNRAPNSLAIQGCMKFAEGLKNLSSDRVKGELFKILNSTNVMASLSAMAETGVLQVILPQATRPDVLEFLINLEHSAEIQPDPILRLASLIHPPEKNLKNLLQSVSKKIKLSKKELNKLEFFLSTSSFILPDMTEDLAKQYIYINGYNLFMNSLFLSWSRFGKEFDYAKQIKIAAEFDRPIFPVSGKDIELLDIKEKKVIGKIIEQTQKWWIENNFKYDKQECLNYIKNKLM